MSQHDFEIANQGFPATRADLNNALQALASNSAGTSEPTTTFAYQFWYDDTNDLLKLRNSDDDAWITLAAFDQTNDEWEIRSAVIQAVDSAGVVIKTDDGTTRLTIADDGSITTQGDLTVGGDLDVSSGTIKLDGNYPAGTRNVALGETALDSNSTGNFNVAIGNSALTTTTSGSYNVAVGDFALSASTASFNTALGQAAQLSNTTGSNNTAVGQGASQDNQTGSGNTAVGRLALNFNTASNNTAVGLQVMESNTTGADNAAVGRFALSSNLTGSYNVAMGYNALTANTSGTQNVAIGYFALDTATGASNNTGVGYKALTANSSGFDNVAVGRESSVAMTSGAQNTSVGGRSLTTNQTGNNNTAFGFNALLSSTGSWNTAIGKDAGNSITTGEKNVILGSYSGNQGGLDIRTSSNNIVLSDGDGNPRMYFGTAGQANIKNSTGGTPTFTIFNESNSATGDIGLVTALGSNAIDTSSYQYIAGTIGGSDRMYVYGNGNVVNTNNSYGALSDQKLKENIVDSGSQWDDVKALRVRKYSMIEEASDTPTQIGVIAQELESSGMGGLVFESPDRQNEGETIKQVNYSVLYMKAVKALQEAIDRIETLEAKVATLEGN